MTLVIASVGEPELPFPPNAEEPDTAAADAATDANGRTSAPKNSVANSVFHGSPDSSAQGKGAGRDSGASKHSMPAVAPSNSPSRIAARGNTLGNATQYSPEGASIYGNQTHGKKAKRRGLKITVIVLAVIAIAGAAIFGVMKVYSPNVSGPTDPKSGGDAGVEPHPAEGGHSSDAKEDDAVSKETELTPIHAKFGIVR